MQHHEESNIRPVFGSSAQNKLEIGRSRPYDVCLFDKLERHKYCFVVVSAFDMESIAWLAYNRNIDQNSLHPDIEALDSILRLQ